MEGELEYEVEEILDSHTYRNQFQYLVLHTVKNLLTSSISATPMPLDALPPPYSPPYPGNPCKT